MATSEIISLENSSFMTDVVIQDPKTKEEFSITCEIDTGNPDALALPANYSSEFSRLLALKSRGGAGIGLSEMYIIEILRIGSLSVSHPTGAVMSLPPNWSHGLIGIDTLRYMFSKIHDDPEQKKMSLEPSHM